MTCVLSTSTTATSPALPIVVALSDTLPTFLIQSHQANEDFVIGHFSGVIVSPKGLRYSDVQALAQLTQPGRVIVVQVCQRARFQLLLKPALGQNPIWIWARRHANRDDLTYPVSPLRRVEPGVALAAEFYDRRSDLHLVCSHRRKGKGFETSFSVVGGVVANTV